MGGITSQSVPRATNPGVAAPLASAACRGNYCFCVVLKGSPIPHAKAPANPPFSGRPFQQLAGNRTWKVRLSFRAAAGITFQLPCGKDVSCSAVLAGGCRSSGWALVLLAVAGVPRWPVGFWLFRFPFRGRRPEDRSEGVSLSPSWTSFEFGLVSLVSQECARPYSGLELSSYGRFFKMWSVSCRTRHSGACRVSRTL